MSADAMCNCGGAVVVEDNKSSSSSSSKLSGIRLFKSIVRRVRQKITETKLIKISANSDDEELPTMVAKLDRMSLEDRTNANSLNSPSTALFGGCELSRNGYNSDSGTEKRRDTRVRIRQKLRSRSKSDTSRKSNKKKPKKILRPPPTYVYVRGLSGIPTQRIRVR